MRRTDSTVPLTNSLRNDCGRSTLISRLVASSSPILELAMCVAGRTIDRTVRFTDGLVFTASIGQHGPKMRSRICARCAWLGIHPR
jgi:hypothetical protein